MFLAIYLLICFFITRHLFVRGKYAVIPHLLNAGFRLESDFEQAALLKHKISLKCIQDFRGATDLKGKQTVILLAFLPCGYTNKNTS